MPEILSLRYSAAGGPVRVFVNGFLLVNDLAGESVGTRLEAFVAPGSNVLRIEVPPVQPVDFAAQVVRIGEDGTGAETVLAKLPPPEPVVPGQAMQVEFPLPLTMPRWEWMQFQPIPDAAIPTAHVALANLASLLRRGPDADLLVLLRRKHSEIGAAMGIGQEAMDSGLSDGLARRRSNPDFEVEVVDRDQLALVWSRDRRLARALRTDGRDAIQLRSDGEWQGFAVTMGFHENRWMVIR